jgi:hypothetical protein
MNKLKSLLNSVLLIFLSTLLVIAYLLCERALTMFEEMFHIGAISIFALRCVEILFLLHFLNEIIEFTFDVNLRIEIAKLWRRKTD